MEEKPGREIFNSSWYESNIKTIPGNVTYHTATIHFKEHADLNRFLNWWVLGQLPESFGEGGLTNGPVREGTPESKGE